MTDAKPYRHRFPMTIIQQGTVHDPEIFVR